MIHAVAESLRELCELQQKRRRACDRIAGALARGDVFDAEEALAEAQLSSCELISRVAPHRELAEHFAEIAPPILAAISRAVAPLDPAHPLRRAVEDAITAQRRSRAERRRERITAPLSRLSLYLNSRRALRRLLSSPTSCVSDLVEV